MARWVERRIIAPASVSFAVRVIVICIAMTALSTSALGQTAARPDRGVRSTGSYAVSDIENINMTNGNLNISIPLASLPPIAGGKLGWTIGANYNSKVFDMYRYEDEDNSQTPPARFITSHLQLSSLNSWFIGGAYRLEITESHSDVDWRDPLCTIEHNPCDPDYDLMQQHPLWYKVTLIAPDGTTHELRPVNGSGDYPNLTREYLFRYSWTTPDTTGTTMSYYSYDGSFLWASIQSSTQWDVYMPDGTRIKNRGARQWIFDANLNQIKITSDTVGTVSTTHFTDEQTGREIRYVFDSSLNQPWGQGRVEYQTVGGGWTSVLINFRSTFISGWAYEVGDPNCDRAELVTKIAPVAEITVVGSIVLPQTEVGITRQFSFAYNSDSSVPADYYWRPICGGSLQHVTSMSKGLGSLSQITMPTGAVVNYSYLNDLPAAGPITVPLNPSDLPADALIRKELVHDGTTDVWNYSPCIQFGVSSMTGPDGSNVSERSYPHDRAFQYSLGGLDGRGGLTYRTAQKNIQGSEVMVTERKWAASAISGVAAGATGSSELVPFNPVMKIEFTTLMDPPGTPSKMSAKQFEYDLNGNVTSETDYDWFAPSLADPYRDAQGVPSQVPPGATVLRVLTNTFYNSPGLDPNSPNIYYKRVDGSPPSPLILNARQTSVIGPSQSEFYYDGSLSLSTAPTKGNVTKERHWDGTNWIETTHTYDTITGNLTSTTAPKGSSNPDGSVTQFFYDSTQALPSSIVVDPLNGTGQQTTSTAYDFGTGLPISVTDVNGRTTSTVYTNQQLATPDPFNRPGVITNPQGRRVVTKYLDNARQVEVWSDLTNAFDSKLRTRTSVDQLGRSIKSETSEDGSTYSISSETFYLQMGKIINTTNPQRASAAATDGWIRTSKDDLGRVTAAETLSGRYPSGTSTGIVTTNYNGNATTVTDQAGKVRRSIVDGMGRLVRVDEPDSSGDPGSVTSPIQPTSYTYDSRGNLTQVVQGSQTRSFVYDGLSRLKQATNPESGTINYDYYDNGNLFHKTDPRGAITFDYDGLNRVKTRSYGDLATPDVTYVYDTLGAGLNGKGRLTSVSSSVSSYSYGSYDVMGRVLTATQTTGGNAYSITYQYNLAGEVTTETYPSGRVVTTDYDPVGRISTISGQKAGEPNKTYASGFSYTAHGATASVALGNGLIEGTTFNSRLQPTFIKLGTVSNPTSVLQLGYEYTSACQSGNNGNVMRQTISAPGLSLAQDYCYDSLNRLSSANENSGANWSQTYGYDRFGNRWVSASTGYMLSSLTPTQSNHFNTANNRLVMGPSHYDGSGNLDIDAQGRTFTYDRENRQITFNGTAGQYFYDGDGRRVKKIDSSGTTIFVYNVSGQLIAEYHSDTVPPAEGGGGTSYLTSDHLGSTRVVTKSDGSVKARYDYLPFGEELGSTIGGRTTGMGYSAADSTKQKFTQKERDNESGLDYFLARYYSSTQGRFTSADSPFVGQHKADPQSWNLYAYVRNNPLVYVDPTGEGAEVTVENDEQNKTGRITIRATFAIYAVPGSSVSDEDLDQAAALIKSQIQAAWSGQFEKDGITYTVVTQIDVSVKSIEDAFAAGEGGKAMNVVAISPTYAPNLTSGDASSFVSPSDGGKSYDFGHFGLKGLRETSDAAHEFTHLLGVKDLPGPILSNTDPVERRKGGALLQATDADFHAALGGAVYESRHAYPKAYQYAVGVFQNAVRAMDPKHPRAAAKLAPYRTGLWARH